MDPSPHPELELWFLHGDLFDPGNTCREITVPGLHLAQPHYLSITPQLHES